MRRAKKYLRPVKPLDSYRLMGCTRYETGGDGLRYKVHHIRAAAKEYRCPGCNGIIAVGTAHEVAWTEEGWFGAAAGRDERRHWHTGCWRARGHRR